MYAPHHRDEGILKLDEHAVEDMALLGVLSLEGHVACHVEQRHDSLKRNILIPFLV